MRNLNFHLTLLAVFSLTCLTIEIKDLNYNDYNIFAENKEHSIIYHYESEQMKEIPSLLEIAKRLDGKNITIGRYLTEPENKHAVTYKIMKVNSIRVFHNSNANYVDFYGDVFQTEAVYKFILAHTFEQSTEIKDESDLLKI